jgi:hypothetical protein
MIQRRIISKLGQHSGILVAQRTATHTRSFGVAAWVKATSPQFQASLFGGDAQISTNLCNDAESAEVCSTELTIGMEPGFDSQATPEVDVDELLAPV